MLASPDLGFLIHEPFDVYRQKAGQYLTSHLLGDFRKCPLLYHRKRQHLIPDEDRPAYLLGRATHTLILEGYDRFEQEYAVGGPINDKTGRRYGSNTKAWAEWAADQGKPALSDEQYDLVTQLHAAVRAHQLARDLLSAGTAEAVVRVDRYAGVPCQIRMDWFDPHRGIVDLKTCDDLTWFEHDARRYGYIHQLAFYRGVLAQVVSLAMPVFFIAVEKKQPFRCGVWQVSQDALSLAQQENEAAIARLQRCVSQGDWPTGYEEVRFFDYV